MNKRISLMDRDSLRQLIMKYLLCGKRSQGQPLTRFHTC